MELGGSLESTPTWAVAVVVTGLILVSLFFEHMFHVLSHFLKKRRRKALNQALHGVMTELRNLGFMSLLLTMAKQPISKICIPSHLANSFLPCKISEHPHFDEAPTCQEKGKVSLISEAGVQQLQLLIFTLAVFHVLSCIATLALGEAKMKKWKYWEEETKTMEYQLANDPRRLKLSRETSFGRRHLKLWSNYRLLLWLVCFIRQFTGSVSKADYFALRHGFLKVHFNMDKNYDFRKFLRRSVDHDFKAVVRISDWVWVYAMLIIFFNAHGFRNHYWTPMIPLVILLIVGMKLEVIITKMCLKGSQDVVLVQGTVFVKPDNNFFWFGRPQLLLHAIHFILIQNSFHLAFFAWSWYKFGFRSCFHDNTQEIALSIGVGIIVQLLCAYVTLPLYALVTQMGSNVKESIFADRVIEGLKNWQRTAKKSLAEKQRTATPSPPSTPSTPSSPLRRPSSSSTSEIASTPNPRLQGATSQIASASNTRLRGATSQIASTSNPRLQGATSQIASASNTRLKSVPTSENASTSNARLPRVPEFKYPSGRLELLEVQRVVEELIQFGPNGSRGSSPYDGEFSFRMWKRQASEPPRSS